MLQSIVFLLVCFLVCGNGGGLRSEFSTKKEADEYMQQFMVYYDHLKGGNVNANFEFIQFYIKIMFRQVIIYIIYCII